MPNAKPQKEQDPRWRSAKSSVNSGDLFVFAATLGYAQLERSMSYVLTRTNIKFQTRIPLNFKLNFVRA